MKKIFKILILIMVSIVFLSPTMIEAQGAGTLSSPYDMKSLTNISFQEYSLEPKYNVGIQLLETYDGKEAADFVSTANMFNDKAQSGEQWIVLRIKLKHNGGTSESLNASDMFYRYGSNFIYKSNGQPLKPREFATFTNVGMNSSDVVLDPGAEGEFYYGVLLNKTDGYPYFKISSNSSTKTYKWFKTSPKKIANSISTKYTEKTVPLYDYGHLSASISPSTYPIQRVFWSSGNTDIAMVEANGRVYGRELGSTYIYAKSANGKSVRILVRVKEPTTSIELGISERQMTIGDTYRFPFSIKPYSAEQVAKWRVGNSAIASVDSNGTVTAKAPGNTYIYAKTWDGKEVKCMIKIKGVPTTSINIIESSKNIGINKSTKLNLSVSPSITTSSVTWKVGNSTIATVSTNGTVTGKKAGSTYVYAKTWDGKEDKCLIKVLPNTSSVNLSYTTKTFALGSTLQLSSTTNPTSAGNANTWRSGNSTIAAVDASGLVTAKSVGNTYIYVKTWDGKEARCLLKVLPSTISLSLNNSTKTMSVGASYQLKSAVNSSYTTVGVTWRIGNIGIASIDATGKVTAKSKGSTYAYAKTWDGKEVKCLIKVQ